ncbi:unnamed protein product [Rotaria magnacalcarata]|uniref:HAT C-terminal dimerisation domain-containing protein n=1 Tax=Rotaria magnacalcarata TaxID=392030 RepID=A0A820N7N3_9BILA|nr:unnamed protein product [Rotaria magnacalcarata]CAF2070792.1 unnamed protein product [Rotaria magnacalcarata]CAF4316491.1 unnamed protein product [Rotaria magnacalcarata]CAF4384493.1 unnamed protein product [Rotaria magnacalcarata]
MLERLLSHRSLVDEIFAKRDYKGLTSTQEGKLRSLIFTYDDWELLIALRDCLEPFDKATTALSGDYPTQSMSYFVIQSLHENFQHSFNPTYYHAVINKSLYFQSKYYLDAFLRSAQKIGMKVAAFLDPVFHGDLIAYKEDYEMAKRVVMEAMQQTDPLEPDASAVLSYDESRNSSSTANAAHIMLFKSNFMNITGKQASAPLSIQPLTADFEMAAFFILVRDNESIDFRMFWRNHSCVLPRLSQVARQYNVSPGTSVYLEQLFSVAGAIRNIRQASMSSITLRSLMILKKKKNIEKLRSFAPS